MIKCLVCDLYKVLVFPLAGQDSYNPLYLNFESALATNTELLEVFKDISLKKIIFTSMDKVSLDSQLVNFFKAYNFEIIEANKLGLDKASTYAYEYLVKNILGLNFSEVIFIDDQFTNISAASKLGITTIQYNSEIDRNIASKEVKTKLKSILFS